MAFLSGPSIMLSANQRCWYANYCICRIGIWKALTADCRAPLMHQFLNSHLKVNLLLKSVLSSIYVAYIVWSSPTFPELTTCITLVAVLARYRLCVRSWWLTQKGEESCHAKRERRWNNSQFQTYDQVSHSGVRLVRPGSISRCFPTHGSQVLPIASGLSGEKFFFSGYRGIDAPPH